MTHCSDDDLVLAYYGEDGSPASHVAGCADCAARYRELTAVLDALADDPPPDRSPRYGLEVWQRIRYRLPEPEPWWHAVWTHWRAVAIPGMAVALLAIGFTGGRFWPAERPTPLASAPVAELEDNDRARRVLLLSIADHLERSDRVLTSLVNAPPDGDISAEQAWALDLVADSRLFRQDALAAQEPSIADVLDELERTLLDVVHGPSSADDEELEELRRQIDSAALLFKVRVVSDELRAASTSISG